MSSEQIALFNKLVSKTSYHSLYVASGIFLIIMLVGLFFMIKYIIKLSKQKRDPSVKKLVVKLFGKELNTKTLIFIFLGITLGSLLLIIVFSGIQYSILKPIYQQVANLKK